MENKHDEVASLHCFLELNFRAKIVAAEIFVVVVAVVVVVVMFRIHQ